MSSNIFPWTLPSSDFLQQDDIDLIAIYELPIENYSLLGLSRYNVYYKASRRNYMYWHKEYGYTLNSSTPAASESLPSSITVTSFQYDRNLTIRWVYNLSTLSTSYSSSPTHPEVTMDVGVTYLSSHISFRLMFWSDRVRAGVGSSSVYDIITAITNDERVVFSILISTSSSAITNVNYNGNDDLGNDHYPGDPPADLTDNTEIKLDFTVNQENNAILTSLNLLNPYELTSDQVNSSISNLQNGVDTLFSRTDQLTSNVNTNTSNSGLYTSALTGFLTNQNSPSYKNVNQKITSSITSNTTALDSKYGYSSSNGSFQSQINSVNTLVGEVDDSASTSSTYNTSDSVISNVKGVISNLTTLSNTVDNINSGGGPSNVDVTNLV